jgi:hypothetical protein
MSISVKRLFFTDTLLLGSEFELFFEFMTIPKALGSLKKRFLISLKKYPLIPTGSPDSHKPPK